MGVNLLLFVEIQSHGLIDESIFATFLLLGNWNSLVSGFSVFSMLLINRSFLLISFFSDSFSFFSNNNSSLNSFSFSDCLTTLLPWLLLVAFRRVSTVSEAK